MTQIENDELKVSIDFKGGSLNSIYDKKRNKELLYQPRKDSWQGQDVFIFPFIARLKNQTYTYENKEYHLKNHGLIRYMEGKRETSRDDVSIVFESDEETKKQYPFDFVAHVKYKLVHNKLIVSYLVKNKSNTPMPYMIGGHPAFMLPGIERVDEFDISGNYVTFDKTVSLIRIEQEETCSFNIGENEYKITDKINLSKELFHKINTYIFKANDFRFVTLHKLDGSTITLDIGEAKYLALWSGNSYGNFVAIEPWNGVPDYLDSSSDITKKKGIEFLSAGEETCFSYSITIN